MKHYENRRKVVWSVWTAKIAMDALGVRGLIMILLIRTQFFSELLIFVKCIRLVSGLINTFGINWTELKMENSKLESVVIVTDDIAPSFC